MIYDFEEKKLHKKSRKPKVDETEFHEIKERNHV